MVTSRNAILFNILSTADFRLWSNITPLIYHSATT